MTKRTERTQSSKKIRSQGDASSLNALEKRVIAMAEQLGRIAGNAQANTDGWLDRPAFKNQLARVREGAADLLERLAAHSTGKSSAGPSPKAPKGRSGGKVDAPGKKHRKAPDAVRGVKHSDQKISKAIAARRMTRGKPRQG